jgi:hypothetical protein
MLNRYLRMLKRFGVKYLKVKEVNQLIKIDL